MSAETQTDLSRESQTLLDNLKPYVLGNKQLSEMTEADRAWLATISEMVGRGRAAELVLQEGGEQIDVLSPTSLQQNLQSKVLLEKLYYSLNAMLAAHRAGGDASGCLSAGAAADAAASNRVVIHNREVAAKLRDQYTLETFDQLFEFCKNKGVFTLKVNETSGLVTTADAAENWDMSGRQWVTDTVRCGDIERGISPHAWTHAVLTLCDFYHQDEEMEAIKNSIADPDYYRLGGLLNGVAHIFIPHTLKRDTTWFNNKRLESHGLALKAICDTVIAGVCQKQPWGFTGEQLQKHGEKIARTIAALASYLKSINTDKNGRFDFAAPSAGPWEEIPFPEGLTWDTEAIRSGFESLRALLFEKQYENVEAIKPLRTAIIAHQFGGWLESPGVLDQLLRQARGKIIDRLFGNVLPVESPHRPLDCSLGFIATSTITFDDNVISDVLLHYQLLEVIEEKLVRGHGIIRYAPFALTMEDGRKEPVFDAYLADNYWLLPQLRAIVSGIAPEASDDRHFGSSDCSSHDDYLARVKMARPGTEAQWCFVSVIAEAYCLQVQKLQAAQAQTAGGQPAAGQGAEAKIKSTNQDPELEKLIAFGIEKASEYINRSFARVTAPGWVKANGRECPAWSIPEAFELVSPVGPACGSSLSALAGANTPLAWGQASLYRACELFRQILSSSQA